MDWEKLKRLRDIGVGQILAIGLFVITCNLTTTTNLGWFVLGGMLSLTAGTLLTHHLLEENKEYTTKSLADAPISELDEKIDKIIEEQTQDDNQHPDNA